VTDEPSVNFRGNADARTEAASESVLEATVFTSSSLSMLLFSYSDDESCLHDRVFSTSDMLISSSFSTASSGGAVTGSALLFGDF
jgi:hypothetical protein